MVELPPFLKRCYRFPCSVEEDREDDWWTPSRRRHRVWGRAFELSVSSEALLETTDAAELLFQFLFAKYKDNAPEEDENEDENDEALRRKIIWMSDNIFISASSHGEIVGDLHEYLEQRLCKVYSALLRSNYQDFEFRSCNVDIILQPTTTTTTTEAATTTVQQQQAPMKMDWMDVLLRLTAMHKHLTSMKIEAGSRNSGEFPASLDALKALVNGEVGTERNVCLEEAGLSLDQWNAVTANCSKKVTLMIAYNNNSERSSFMETAVLNHCPAKIQLYNLDLAPADNRQILLSAFQSTTLLEELDVTFFSDTMENFFLCIDTISRNRGYRSLRLRFPQYANLTLRSDWGLFCEAIASHPMLQNVQVSCTVYVLQPGINIERDQKIERDQMLIRMIRNNTVLQRFVMDRNFLHDPDTFDEAVGPILEFNRFRKVVHTIKKEHDLVRRKQLFTTTLSSESVRKCPDKRYLLFKENFDMLEQIAALSESNMFCSWQKTMRHLDLLETLMRGRGMEIPSRREEDKITWLARTRKRKQSSLSE